MQHQLQSHAPLGYGHQASNGSQGYYAPTQQHGSTYGNVYYSANQGGDSGHHANLDMRNQGLSALNNFYPDAQRGVFDPKSYPQVESRLMAIQAGQLSFLGSGTMAEYHTGGSLGGGAQVGVYGPAPQYQLPGLENLRTKPDLLAIDQIMEQAQATIYDRPNQMAAAGVAQIAQPGAYHVRSGIQYRQSQSPPRSQLPSSHYSTMAATSPATVAGSQFAADSPPALTPTDSTHSYASARSPASLTSNGAMSPATSATIYPTLPSTSSAAMSHGYFPSGMAPTSALGTQFSDNDYRRGGHLHKAQPLRTAKIIRAGAMKHAKKIDDDDMDTSSDDGAVVKPSGSSSPLSEEDKATPQPRSRPEVSPSMIDPALSGATVVSPSGELDEGDIKANEVWVGIVRTIEDLREWIRYRLENGEYENSNDGHEDGANGRVVKTEKDSTNASHAIEGLYPVLADVGVES